MNKPCIKCGELTSTSPCAECSPTINRERDQQTIRDHPSRRGYDRTWRNLSERARRAQPWCTDCGSTTNLDLDHLPSAWERKEAGLPIRLGVDVEVVCHPCNNARGSSRPGTARARQEQPRGANPKETLRDSRRWAKTVSHFENDSQDVA